MERNELLTLNQEANSMIKTTDVNGKEYAEVPQRVKAFRFVHPNGLINTKMEYIQGEIGSRVVCFTAEIFDGELNKLSQGTAEETENSTFINKKSFIENCETSAVGRALGFAGFGIDRSIASAEEVANAINNRASKNTVTFGNITNATWKELNKYYTKEEIKAMYEECGVTNGKDLKEEYAKKKVEDGNKKFIEEMTAKSQDGKQFY